MTTVPLIGDPIPKKLNMRRDFVTNFKRLAIAHSRHVNTNITAPTAALGPLELNIVPA